MQKTKMALIILFVLLLTPSVVWAAPETAVSLAESEAVNLPGVIGGVVLLVALLLPFTLRAWARHNWDGEG